MSTPRSLSSVIVDPPPEHYVRMLFADTPEGRRFAALLAARVTFFSSYDALPHHARDLTTLEWVTSAVLPRVLPPRDLSSWPQHLAPLTAENLIVLRAVLHWECVRTDVPVLDDDRCRLLDELIRLCSTSLLFTDRLREVARLATGFNVRDTVTVLVSDGMTFEDALQAAEALDS